jgi:hypothetical protein
MFKSDCFLFASANLGVILVLAKYFGEKKMGVDGFLCGWYAKWNVDFKKWHHKKFVMMPFYFFLLHSYSCGVTLLLRTLCGRFPCLWFRLV